MADTPPTTQLQREAEVVSEHLPSGYGASFDGMSGITATASSLAPNLTDTEESSLTLQGGDIHRDLFKTAARARMHRRAATFHHHQHQEEDDELLAVSNQLAPGGFRRAYIQQQHQSRQQFLAARMPVTRNFVEFLDLYGSFAGEDLADSDDEAVMSDEEEDHEDRRPTETRPLLGHRKSTRAPRSADAGMTKTFFTLLKAFIGTGIMFLPKAFSNGGILFSSVTMLLVAAISMVSFHLLLQCKKRYAGGYGELGGAIAGKRMRAVILGSITLSQLGFVCAGIVFVAENLTSFLEAVTQGNNGLSTATLILIQLILLVPLAWIRNISKLGPAALLADVFIMIGLIYIYYFDIAAIATHGVHKSVALFNPEKYTLTIGAAIFTFEGIGLILPIQSSMAKPHRFEYLLGVVMLIITVIFTSVGALCYATFGDNTYIEIINNYPQDNKFVNAVQFLYSLAVLIGTPVQLFPALRILEAKFFGKRSGKKSTKDKWLKNAFRTLLVFVCGGISILGAGNLDRFVALIGSFACVPLVYIYPPYLHYIGIATTWQAKAGDIALMVLGLVCMVYTTIITLVNSFLQ
ncbi:transmembrane amino acid transporter protein-domain-containing protein [Pseudomassariella vexata]|uniref:Transmembrane amino acid transporter protein-domain-containing protein n=1 Tax=Pseudomassariella vexata TaxID=1141098 RepID=A0A1Y2DF35_9PEZI|nr:transmembrane amino acid transporter protein-domain-containing protein [Pseudomassariella vexata]ORY57878.1 transmembrane amino acid transporter protein-domain-containing protein [Pseudomassariella vexata]